MITDLKEVKMIENEHPALAGFMWPPSQRQPPVRVTQRRELLAPPSERPIPINLAHPQKMCGEHKAFDPSSVLR